MITNTLELPQSEYQDHINKMIGLNILVRDKSGRLKLSKIFNRGLALQKQHGVDSLVRDELGSKDVFSNGVFLSGIILIGMCLIPWGIRGNDIFHSINIILKNLQFEQIGNYNAKSSRSFS